MNINTNHTNQKESAGGGIVYIPTEQLHPHPQNPRKDLGDLTELADSIRANGIYQNLTVVYNPVLPDSYIVIIGHRRLAAAKLAGLDAVPCAVVEMTRKQQLETMLLENMQRADLTVLEEAQGLQMLIDLGEDVASLSKSTGFSKQTIKKRLLLTEYKPDSVTKAFQRGATLEDYVQLAKIKDPKRREMVAEFTEPKKMSLTGRMSIISCLIGLVMQYLIETNDNMELFAPHVFSTLNIDPESCIDGVDEEDAERGIMKDEVIAKLADDISDNPIKYLFSLCWSSELSDNPASYHMWSGSRDCASYDNNPYLTALIDIMEGLGLEMPDELRAFVDGTHRIYTKEGCDAIYAEWEAVA